MTFDERGLPQTLSRVVGTQSTLLAQLERNLAGEVVLRASGFAQGQTWSYSDLGQVTRETFRSCAQGAVAYATSKSCAQTGTAVVGGEALTYFRSGDMSSATDTGTGQTLAYTFDAQHQLVTATSSPNATLYSASFTYTPGGRVTRATIASSNATTDVRPRDETYTYPPVTSTTTDPAAVIGLVPGATGSVGSFTYDPTGNLTHRAYGSAEVHDFVYDGDDKLREVTKTTGGDEIYYYDHTGERVLAYSAAVGGVAAKLRQWFGSTELEYSVAATPGTVTKAEVFATLGAMPVAHILRVGAATTIELEYSGVLGHLLGVLSTTNGSAVAKYSYGPYGEELSRSGTEAGALHRRFEGKEKDELSTLSYYGYRYYDRMTLGWTQFDPLYRLVPDLAWTEPRRASLYTFSLNNPLRYVDPDGRDGNAKGPKPIDPDRIERARNDCTYSAAVGGALRAGYVAAARPV